VVGFLVFFLELVIVFRKMNLVLYLIVIMVLLSLVQIERRPWIWQINLTLNYTIG